MDPTPRRSGLIVFLFAFGLAAGLVAAWLLRSPTPAVAAAAGLVGVSASLGLGRIRRSDGDRHLDDFFESAPVGFHWVGPDGAILRANTAELRMLGYSASEYLGRNIAQFHADPAAIQDILARLGRGEALQHYPARLVCKDGSIRHVVISSSALFENGRFVHTRCLTRDVTTAHQAEEERRRAQEHYRTIVETANEGVWLVDGAARTLYVNRRLAEMLGHQPEEMIGRALQEFCFPEDVDAARLHVTRNLEGHPEQFDFRFRRRDGRGVPVLACTNAVRDADGRIIGALGLFTDLTARKRTEEALRYSEERYRALAENVPALVWTARADGSCDYFNQRWCDETGLTLEESLGWGWRKAVHPDDLAATLEQWNHGLATRTSIQTQLRLVRPDGSFRWHLVRANPIYDANGRLAAWFGTCTDIQDQKLAETRLADLNAALSRSNRDLEDFAHIAAHDLREPLRGMRLSASFLVEDLQDKLDPDSRRHLASIDRLGKRMDELVNSLLHYSVVGQSDMAMSRVDLNGLIGGVLESLGPVLRETRTHVRIPQPLPTLRCDPVRVGEVFRNLISNAAKYNTRDERWIEIGARPPENGEPVPILYVRDNGIGIAPQHHQAVFRIFKRLHARDEYGGGTGSGLAIVKRIVERHGGRIWIESALDEGATFLFTLGRTEPAPTASAAPQEPSPLAR